MEIIRKNKMKVLKMKSIVKRNESAFNGLLSRLNSAKKRRQVDRNYPNQNTERKQNENNRTEQNRTFKSCGTISKVLIYW